MGWSSVVMISRSVKSMRFVVGVGAGSLYCFWGCVSFVEFGVVYPSNNVAMSLYIYNTAATIFVVFVVYVVVSNCSIYLILLLRFSIL